MGYYMRFIIEDDRDITLDILEEGIKCIDPLFNLAEWDRECECAELLHGDDLYSEVEISRIDQEDVDEEIEELIEDVEDAVEGDTAKVIYFLKNAKVMIIIRVLWQGRDAEETLDTLAPLWHWLFDNYQGLLQADGEGYYDMEGQILHTD